MHVAGEEEEEELDAEPGAAGMGSGGDPVGFLPKTFSPYPVQEQRRSRTDIFSQPLAIVHQGFAGTRARPHFRLGGALTWLRSAAD